VKFSGLKPGQVGAYIESVRGGEFWLFQHIPKTAGSTVVAELARHRRPYVNIDVADNPDRLRRMPLLEQLTARFLREQRGRRLSACSGHLSRSNIDAILTERPETRLFTFVREPVSRVISEYNYCTSPLHNNPEAFIKRYPTLEHFARNRVSHNFMANYITENRDIDPRELVEYAFERFEFIGSQGYFRLSFRLLSTLLWHTSRTDARERAAAERTRRAAIPRHVLQLIRRNNRADTALFEAVTAVYDSCRDEIKRHTRFKPPVATD